MSGLPVPIRDGPADADLDTSRAKLLRVAIETKPGMAIEGLEAFASSFDALALPDDPWARSTRDRIVRTVRSYLIPRLSDPGKPLTVVFAGPTGAGKSTLINSLAGAELSATGPLRPTTRSPLIFAAADQADVLGHLGGISCDVVVGRAPVLRELSLVDTPDIDSTLVDHRAMAEALIDVGDIVVFVSSALRYADRVPWEVLRRARSRGAPIICVLNRVRPDSGGAAHDYRRLLESEGLGQELLTIGEHHLEPAAYSVPSGSIRDLRKRLMSEIASRRLGADQIWRRVMAATCDQALELIDLAEEYSARTRLIESEMISPSDFAVHLDLGEYPPGSFPADQALALVGGSRRRIRRWARRSLPRDAVLALERARLTEAVIASADASLRKVAPNSGKARGFTKSHHEMVRAIVESWVGAPAGTSMPVRGVEDSAIALLVRIASVSSSEWPRIMLELLVPGVEVSSVASEPRETLRMTLLPAYENVRRQAFGHLAPPATSEDMNLARAAVTGVIARVSFADA